MCIRVTPQILFHNLISLSRLNYFDNLRKSMSAYFAAGIFVKLKNRNFGMVKTVDNETANLSENDRCELVLT